MKTLQQLKNNETPLELIILSKPNLCEFLIAWKNSDISCDESAWDSCVYDIEQIALLSALRVGDAKIIMKQLQGLALIYPDGTINSYAEKYLTLRAKSTLKGA